MFGTIAASGVRIVSREPLNRRAIMIMALSLAVGLGVSQQPLILQFAPDWMKLCCLQALRLAVLLPLS